MSLVVRAAILFCLIGVTACGEFIVDDKDFSSNRRSLDVTSQNAEPWLWSMYFSVFENLNRARLNFALDPNEFGVLRGEGRGICSGDGGFSFYYSKGITENYKAGDKMWLEYENCSFVTAGPVYNGRVAGEYKSIDGYNLRMTPSVASDECLANVEREEEPTGFVIDDSADLMTYERIGRDGVVQFVDLDDADPPNRTVLSEYLIQSGEIRVVRNRAVDMSGNDEVFVVKDLEIERIQCDFFKRTVELAITDLSVLNDGIKTSISGTFEIDETFNSLSSRSYELVSKDATVLSVQYDLLSESYDLYDLVWRYSYDPVNNRSYMATLSGELVSRSTNEIVEFTSGNVFGEFDERFPTSGFIELLGVDLEGAILSVVSKDEARVGIRAEGDTTGDGRPDFSQPVFLIDWLDFVDRDFKALP